MHITQKVRHLGRLKLRGYFVEVFVFIVSRHFVTGLVREMFCVACSRETTTCATSITSSLPSRCRSLWPTRRPSADPPAWTTLSPVSHTYLLVITLSVLACSSSTYFPFSLLFLSIYHFGCAHPGKGFRWNAFHLGVRRRLLRIFTTLFLRGSSFLGSFRTMFLLEGWLDSFWFIVWPEVISTVNNELWQLGVKVTVVTDSNGVFRFREISPVSRIFSSELGMVTALL